MRTLDTISHLLMISPKWPANINTEMLQFFHRGRVRHEPTPPYSHESNGILEGYNRTI